MKKIALYGCGCLFFFLFVGPLALLGWHFFCYHVFIDKTVPPGFKKQVEESVKQGKWAPKFPPFLAKETPDPGAKPDDATLKKILAENESLANNLGGLVIFIEDSYKTNLKKFLKKRQPVTIESAYAGRYRALRTLSKLIAYKARLFAKTGSDLHRSARMLAALYRLGQIMETNFPVRGSCPTMLDYTLGMDFKNSCLENAEAILASLEGAPRKLFSTRLKKILVPMGRQDFDFLKEIFPLKKEIFGFFTLEESAFQYQTYLEDSTWNALQRRACYDIFVQSQDDFPRLYSKTLDFLKKTGAKKEAEPDWIAFDKKNHTDEGEEAQRIIPRAYIGMICWLPFLYQAFVMDLSLERTYKILPPARYIGGTLIKESELKKRFSSLVRTLNESAK